MQVASIYKSADQLGIKQWERDGLVRLIGCLSRGEIKLNMKMSMCGAIGCIGGHVAVEAGVEPRGYVSTFTEGYLSQEGNRSNCSLARLYYPSFTDNPDKNHEERHPGWNATSEEAARAIVNFLVTAEAQWDAVMRVPA